ncbi:MAG: ABC transporter permease [Planctomycetaceae bacterium]|nr:ABC transporter permease [Planctomycetaceae bacterium]
MKSYLAVLGYEMRRSLTASRMMWWIVLASLPVIVTALLRFGTDLDKLVARGQIAPEALDTTWSVLFYVIVVCVCCCLGVFLNTAPAVAAELEQHSWVYMATRPNGIRCLLLGKYTVGVLWAVTAGFTGLTAGALLSNAPSSMTILKALLPLCLFSTLCYGAIYLMIGTVMPKRAMVLSVGYTVLVEIILGMIPAVVNRLTIQYRLRSLFVQWAPVEVKLQEGALFRHVFDDTSALSHLVWLLGLLLCFLTAAQAIAHLREFTQASEGDV